MVVDIRVSLNNVESFGSSLKMIQISQYVIKGFIYTVVHFTSAASAGYLVTSNDKVNWRFIFSRHVKGTENLRLKQKRSFFNAGTTFNA